MLLCNFLEAHFTISFPISRTVQGALEQALITLRPINEVNVNFANEWVNMEIMKLVFSI